MRFYSLDVLRGLASLGVVFWHWQMFYFGADGLPDDFDRTNQPLYKALFLFYERGFQGVDVFFCLSGFVFFWLYAEKIANGMPAREFAMRRFARLYPLHLATLGAVIALQWTYSSVNRHAFVYVNDGWNLLLNLLMAQGWAGDVYSFNGPAWSLSVEVLLYAAFFVLCRYKQGGAFVLAMIVLASAAYLGGYNGAVRRGFMSFFIGGLTFHAYRYLVTFKRQDLIEAGLRVAMVLGWSGALIGLRLGWYVSGPFEVAFLFPVTVLCLAIAETRRGPIGKRLAILGDASYAIYLLNVPLMMVFALALPQSAFASPLTLVAFVSALIGCAVMSHRYFERPAQKWLLGRFQHLRADRGPRDLTEPVGVGDSR